MAEYEVCLPITGKLWVTVEAESEDEAVEAALNSTLSPDDLEEWEAHRRVLQGNVFYGMLNNAFAERQD